jgi:hypothetical protein
VYANFQPLSKENQDSEKLYTITASRFVTKDLITPFVKVKLKEPSFLVLAEKQIESKLF